VHLFVLQLFGWDIGALWKTSNKKLILALLAAGRLGEAFESYRFAMDASNEATKTSLHSWVLSESFKQCYLCYGTNHSSLSSLVVMNSAVVRTAYSLRPDPILQMKARAIPNILLMWRILFFTSISLSFRTLSKLYPYVLYLTL